MNIQMNIPVFRVFSITQCNKYKHGNNSLQNPLSRDTIKCTYIRQIYNIPSLIPLFSLFD